MSEARVLILHVMKSENTVRTLRTLKALNL